MFALPLERNPIPKTGMFLTLILGAAVIYGVIFAISQVLTEEECNTVIEWGIKPLEDCQSFRGQIRCFTADYIECTNPSESFLKIFSSKMAS